MPMIPLVLTAIASADDLPIQTYILADTTYMPSGWAMTRDIAAEIMQQQTAWSGLAVRTHEEFLAAHAVQ